MPEKALFGMIDMYQDLCPSDLCVGSGLNVATGARWCSSLVPKE